MTKSADKVRDIANACAGIFTYVPDMMAQGKRDQWSYTLTPKGKLYDDCDGAVMFMADEATKAGIDWQVVVCDIPTRGSYEGHSMIYFPEPGLIVDCLNPIPVDPRTYSCYRWSTISEVNSIKRWRYLGGWN